VDKPKFESICLEAYTVVQDALPPLG
jgi:hypothetical protein